MHPRLRAVAWVAVLVFSSALHAEEVIPLAVRDGHCSFVIPTDAPYFLVVGSLARQAGPFHVSIATEATDAPADLPRAPAAKDPDWARRTAELRGRLDRARQAGAPLEEFPPLARPPRERTFHLFVGKRDLGDPAGHVAIAGELRGLGRYCQVYVDRASDRSEALAATIEDIVTTFDTDIYPHARRLGRVIDVDRDGRFTILLTGWLQKMAGGTVALGGCVRGSDFDRDLAAPLGNRCDMMFLNADLKPGPHLHVLLAHEYTHALVFCEHAFGNYLPEQPRVEEDAWLNEGLAHLAEVRHGWSNIGYRIEGFLAAPQHCQLVVPDYYAAGLWRSAGHRGAAFLFLRWCAERHGPEFVTRLVRSNLTGVANLEAATGEPFAELFRQWTVALVNRDRWLTMDHEPFRLEDITLPGGRWQGSLAGTSAAFVLLRSSVGAWCRVTVTADAAAALQVSLVPVTPASGRPLEVQASRLAPAPQTVAGP